MRNRWYRNWTICGEMYRRRWISTEEFKTDQEAVKRKFTTTTMILYKLTVTPLVLAMKFNTPFAKQVAEVVWDSWISKQRKREWK